MNLYAYCANNPVFYADLTGNEKDTLGERYRQQEIDNYVANKRAGLDTGDVAPEIAAQGNAAIKALEAIDKQLGYSKQDPAAGETNRSANRVDAPQADVPSASSQMEGSGAEETALFLPDNAYNKQLPKCVTSGTKSLPKYDELGTLKQIKYYDDYGREIGGDWMGRFH